MTSPIHSSDLFNLFTSEPAKCTFMVSNFVNDTTKCLASPEFYPPNRANNSVGFRIQVYPNETVTMLGANHTVVMLFATGMSNMQHTDLSVYYRLALINEKGERCHSEERRAKFYYDYNYAQSSHLRYHCGIRFNGQYTIGRSYLADKANGLLPDGNLTVSCEVFVLNDQCLAASFSRDNLISLFNNYKSFLDSKKLSDVVLAVDKQEFAAHKAILASQSAVLAAMFKHQLEESKQNRVQITDMSADGLKDLLQFIYTGKVTVPSQNACELYAAADKYQIEALKTFCHQYLVLTLSNQSVIDAFQLAELYNIAELKAKCIEYISAHSNEFKFEDWKQLTASRPELMFKVFQISSTKQAK